MKRFFGIGEDDNSIELEDEIEQTDISEKDAGQIALDILDNEYEVVIIAPIAGIDLDNIDLSFAKSVLTIKGHRKKPDFYNQGMALKNSECFWGEFVRNIILPENLDFESIQATMENNLLVIQIKKLQFSSQNIKVNRVEI